MGAAGVLKLVCIVMFLVVAGIGCVTSKWECGNRSQVKLVKQLAPCGNAAKNVKAEVSKKCCAAIADIGKNPKCLCAIMLSRVAKAAGLIPEAAICIPKRCNMPRPVGFKKCGKYTVP